MREVAVDCVIRALILQGDDIIGRQQRTHEIIARRDTSELVLLSCVRSCAGNELIICVADDRVGRAIEFKDVGPVSVVSVL